MHDQRIVHPYRNRSRLHHSDDSFIVYMNGTRYSKQWLSDVEHGKDWYDPHWREEYKTPLNQQIYRFTGKVPWLSWNKYFTSAIVSGLPLLAVNLLLIIVNGISHLRTRKTAVDTKTRAEQQQRSYDRSAKHIPY